MYRLAFSEPAPTDAAPAYNLTPAMFKYVMRGQVCVVVLEGVGNVTQPPKKL